MQRKTFDGMNCSIARALDQVGEWWSLLIIRECTFGTTRFDEFQERLGIARNILTSRLNRLTELGIVEKYVIDGKERRQGYRLTDKGEALFPVLLSFLQWGDQWAAGPAGSPVRYVERDSGKDLAPLGPRTADGRVLGLRDVRMLPGPGATAAVQARIDARNAALLGEEQDADN